MISVLCVSRELEHVVYCENQV